MHWPLGELGVARRTNPCSLPPMLDRLSNPSWKLRPLRTGMRVAASLVRRRVPGMQRASLCLKPDDFRVIADLGTAYGLGLYRYGWQNPDVELVTALLRPSDVFVDGGAHVGMFTLAACKHVGLRGRVFAYEPAHETFAALNENILANGFSWATPIPAALGRAPGFATFVAFSGDGAGLSSFVPGEGGGRKLLVPVVTLDMLAETLAGQTVRVVKLDLEGAEHEALRGATQMLEQRPHLLIEVVPSMLERMGTSASAMISDLRELGYEFFRRTGRMRLERAKDPTELLLPNPNVFATSRVEEAKRAGIHFEG
jgi:FkbM family methyltransferase